MGMDLQEYLDRGSAGLDFVYATDTSVYRPRPAYLMPVLLPWRDPTIVIKSFMFAR